MTKIFITPFVTLVVAAIFTLACRENMNTTIPENTDSTVEQEEDNGDIEVDY